VKNAFYRKWLAKGNQPQQAAAVRVFQNGSQGDSKIYF
jgi:hypothetical protein